METNILLESGTNELEILEFAIGNNHYGINVAKIKEILPFSYATPIPNSHPCIEGVYMPRNEIITVIDLSKSLGITRDPDPKSDMFIITNFNKLNVAFHICSVFGIHRISWTEIMKPDESINNKGNGIATGFVKLNGQLIVILDFEKIVADISPETSLKISDIDSLGIRERNNSPILIAEDSALLSKLIHDCLSKAGYTSVTVTKNGQEAYDLLCDFIKAGTIKDRVKCLITDIEMPQMDGHHLTKLVKENNDLKHIPVIIFSSLVNEEMKRKGASVGADSQLSKPEIGLLVQEIDRLVLKNN